jgi:hypothetical protein
MSRVRRGDAKLYFPDRVVQMHRVVPTASELALIQAVAKPIQKLNRLAQISILQALTSSPDALMAQLTNMARNGTVPKQLADTVRGIVTAMPPSAKLEGLGKLIDRLKKENTERWRLVVFTTRRETQTTIQAFLENHGLKVGIINGDSGPRNQETIRRFRQDPPYHRVIVSTEAGSEGVNLQVANVLVNFDLPWNPMIVEQRIGRVQRLASEHAHVIIFNIMLRDTFEEYIVGRLMEKLQMAAHAIGDIESLLQGSDIGDGGEDAAASFEERILKLVLAALAGKNVEEETRLQGESIENAKAELERGEKTINELLGSMDGAEYVGPRAPSLPNVMRSMGAREFTLAAFKSLGAQFAAKNNGLYLVEENGGRSYIRFEEPGRGDIKSTLYAAGSAAFQRLVSRVIATGVYEVEDLDNYPGKVSEEIARKWAQGFGAQPWAVDIQEARRCFNGAALVRVRATVAHDSYERLVDVPCSAEDHRSAANRTALGPTAKTIQDPKVVGIDTEKLGSAAALDDAIAEFSRFYLERREQEIDSAGDDERKRRKLRDEFTPRLDMTLVGLEGKLHREVKAQVRYAFDAERGYDSILTIVPSTGEVIDPPELGLCSKSGRSAPTSCMGTCEVTSSKVLRHLLVESAVSGRSALPEFTTICALSGKRVLTDEVEPSAVTENLVASPLLKTSALSGSRAEPEHFGRCGFTDVDVLKSELSVSEISGKPYRMDQQVRSAVSGKVGHRQEFILCHETRQPIAQVEAEHCEVTDKPVRPGVLETCEVTGMRVLPSELERCVATDKRALKRLFVTSSVSQGRVFKDVAIRSTGGNFCAPGEARQCLWSGRRSHPDDLRTCNLTGLPIHYEFATADGAPRLQPLAELLDGVRRTADEMPLWDKVAGQVTAALKGGKCRVEAAVLSPAKRHLATCAEAHRFLGIRVRQVGAVYAMDEKTVVGRIASGKRGPRGWVERAN